MYVCVRKVHTTISNTGIYYRNKYREGGDCLDFYHSFAFSTNQKAP